VWDASVSPFGAATIFTATTPLDLRLPGQQLQAETGLHQNHMRDYDPALGRYAQPDPIGLNGGPHVYNYVGQDPLNYVDPRGLWTVQIGGAGAVNTPVGSIPVGFGIAFDGHGHIAVYGFGGAAAAAGAAADAGVSVQVSDAQTVCDLTGRFYNSSVHAGAGWGGSVDAFTGQSPNGPVSGGGVTLGAAAGASGSIGFTETGVYVIH
jgi:RHS repeat-associated protein